MTTLHLDLESFSKLDLTVVGAYKYAEHSSTEVLCLAYAFDDEPVELWLPGQMLPERLVKHIADGGEVRAHNAQFERTVLNRVAGKKIGFPHIKIRQTVCTAAKMAASGLPRSLGDAAEHLGAHAKDEGGRIVMLQVTKPRRGEVARYTPENSPDKFATLYAYCKTDVLAERSIDRLVPELSPSEQEIYWLDQKINDRGIAVDLHTVAQVKRLIEEYKAELEKEMLALTGLKPTQRDKLADWVRANGWPQLSDMQAETIKAHILDPRLPAKVKRPLLLYSTYGMKAVSKYDTIEEMICADGRLHGMFLYHAANTGRWSSTGVQLHNLFRPVIEPEEVETAFDILPWESLGMLRSAFPKTDPLKVLGSCIRGVLVAPPGKKLVFPDFSGVEARYNAWLWKEEWKLKAFREFDAGTGPDLYKIAYARSFHIEVEAVTKPQRQIGKVMELALGYEGGVGAFTTMAQTYGINLRQLADAAFATLPEDARASAEWMWGKFGAKTGLPHDIYVTCDGLKYLWRQAHPRIRQGWKDLRSAAELAVQNKGTIYKAAGTRCMFKVVEYKGHEWLCMLLPSGRMIRYFSPRWKVPERPEGNDFYDEVVEGELRYFGVDTYTRQYTETSTYGGKLDENAVQGGCADILRAALTRLDLSPLVNKYDLVGHVHDEPIAEVDENANVEAEVRALLCAPMRGLEGLPLAIDQHVARRYRK